LGIARIEKSSIELNRVRKTGSEMAGLAGGRFLTSLFGFYFEGSLILRRLPGLVTYG
jgi:hypothetical protein